MNAVLDLDQLDPAKVVEIDLASENLRRNFIRELGEWAKRPPFYAVHGGAVQVVCARHADVMEVYWDRERFSVEVPKRPGFERFDKFMGVETLTQLDGARHDRLRRLMGPPFAAPSIVALKDKITLAIDGMLDTIEAKGELFDAQADLGQKLMPAVLLDIMFRMDERQKAVFREMSRVIPLATRIPAGGVYPEEFKAAFDNARAVIYDLVDERRERPGDDFISALIEVEEDGDKLSRSELYDQIFTITAAALQSTASSLAAVLWVLGRHPDQFDLVKADHGLIPPAIEEGLRYHGPGFLSFPRFAKLDTEVGGTRIEAGMTVRLSPQGASLDPLQYPDPMRVDVRREIKNSPIFGAGVHHCLGNRLARLTLRIAIERLLQRFPGVRLDDPKYTPSYRGQVSETQIAVLPMRLC